MKIIKNEIKDFKNLNKEQKIDIFLVCVLFILVVVLLLLGMHGFLIEVHPY